MIGTWKKSINQLKEKVASATREIETSHQQFRQLKSETGEALAQYEADMQQFFAGQVAQSRERTAQHISTLPLIHRAPWGDPAWDQWQVAPLDPSHWGLLYAGSLVHAAQAQNGQKYEIPAYLPFVGQGRTLIIQSDDAQTAAAYQLMHSLALRMALMAPYQAQFTFLDPAGLGKAFPIANQLPSREAQSDPYRVLEEVMHEIRRIITTYGLSDHKSFDQVAESVMINERMEFVFAANFPKNYDRRTIERLQNIGINGPVAGKYLIVHCNTDIEMPRDLSLDGFENSHVLDLRQNTLKVSQSTYTFVPDAAVPEARQADLLQKLKDSKPPERKIDFATEVAIPAAQIWQQQAISYIETSVGRSGSSDPLLIWFGAKENEGNRPCSHGMLAAMTGSGKSNLYHVLIMGLAMRYSPVEIALYLIDGKDGVEFQPYKHLPHAEFVSLKSQPQLSRSILAELVEEKQRRNELFSQAGAASYEEYRQKANPKAILPRILLLVDEYQELFEGDREGEASANLRALAAQGRSAGIHMLLGSQKFGAVGMLHQADIFGNIHLRIGMKMSPSDRQALTEFGKEGKQLIAACDLPGKMVLNDQSGDDGSNKIGKVALLSRAERDANIGLLTEKASHSGIPVGLLTTHIFDGNAQPDLLDNPQLGYLLRQGDWMQEEDLERFARQAVHEGGLGEASWFAGERPLLGWVGQEFNVRGYTKVVFRRRLRENLLLLGDKNEARYGMLNALLGGLLLSARPSDCAFVCIDKSIPKTPWSEEIPRFVELARGLGYHTQLPKRPAEVQEAIEALATETNRRHALEDEAVTELPSIFLVITEADRIDDLLQAPSKYGTLEDSPLGAQLRLIYSRGPKLGIHLLMALEAYMPLTSVIGSKGLDFFRHRIAMQMSEDDAFSFVRNRVASRLEVEPPPPIRACYLDMGSNRTLIFKPYVIGPKQRQELDHIRTTLQQRLAT